MKNQQVLHLLNSRRFDLAQEPPLEQIVFRIDFQTIGSIGDYGLLTGRPKAGKTKYLAGAIAAALTRKEVFGMKITLPDNQRRVAHFDTEQGKRSHYNLLALILQLSGLQTMPTHLDSYHCRQDNGASIIAMIDHYLNQNTDTGILFIDGLLDLIESFNDEKHSKFLVNWLKRITEVNNVFVFAVLHRSMSADKSIGHLGSSADRAAQSVLIVEKNKETKQYVLKTEYLRDGDDFTPVAIYFNKNMSLWEKTEYIDLEAAQRSPSTKRIDINKRRPQDYDLSEHLGPVCEIFKSQPVQGYDVLRQNIKEIYSVGMNWATDCVRDLIKRNLIFKNIDGYTNRNQTKMFIEK